MTGGLVALVERRVAEAAALRWDGLPAGLREHTGLLPAGAAGVVGERGGRFVAARHGVGVG